MRMPWSKPAPSEQLVEPALVGHHWTMGNQIASVATTGALWLAIGLGPAGFAVAIWQASRPESVAAGVGGLSVEGQNAQLRAGEFAVRAVTAWLGAAQGQEELVRALLPASSGQTLPQVGLQVSGAMVVGYVDTGAGVWAVTVAATVTDARMTARRFFVLPVKVVGQTATAVSLPREVPSTLLAGAAPESDYPVSVAPDSALLTTASEFLSAYLAGSGDVARLVSPQAAISAVRPAPFVAVQVTNVAAHSEVSASPADGAHLEVMVTANAQVSAQQFVTVQYPLTLIVRAGRWEVAAVRDAPLLAVKQPSPSASQAPAASVSPAPSGSSTSSAQK